MMHAMVSFYEVSCGILSVLVVADLNDDDDIVMNIGWIRSPF